MAAKFRINKEMKIKLTKRTSWPIDVFENRDGTRIGRIVRHTRHFLRSKHSLRSQTSRRRNSTTSKASTEKQSNQMSAREGLAEKVREHSYRTPRAPFMQLCFCEGSLKSEGMTYFGCRDSVKITCRTSIRIVPTSPIPLWSKTPSTSVGRGVKWVKDGSSVSTATADQPSKVEI